MEDNSTILYIDIEYLLLETMALELFKRVTFIAEGKLSVSFLSCGRKEDIQIKI